MRVQRTWKHVSAASRRVRQRQRLGAIGFLAVAVLAAPLASVVAQGGSQAAESRQTTTKYPVGIFDFYEPSWLAPPGPNQLFGYKLSYVTDFNKPLNASMWGKFNGVPKGDPVGLFLRDHVWTSKGMLHLGTWRDKSHNGQWATGGVCLCGVHPKFGAFFVRSRQTAVGPDTAQLLWPSDNSWPPELDFNETGIAPMASSWTDHYQSPNQKIQVTKRINVRHWHTWGIVWTSTSVTFVVDGRAWGVLTSPSQVPHLQMNLDLQQQTWCGIMPECPKVPSQMLVDWVAIYTPVR